MGDLNVEALLTEISPEAPSGPDLSYDADYLELERAAADKPERQVGDSILPAEEPNWKDVGRRSLELLQRSKDLSVMVQLLRAQLVLGGLPGFRDSISVLRGAIERFWPTMHPQMDPDDDNDPTQRMNLISALSPPPDAFGDTMRIRSKLREAKLCKSPRIGAYSLRDVAVATGAAPPANSSDPKIEMSQIDAAFEDTPTEALTDVLAAATESLAEIQQIRTLLGEKVGAHRVPDFKDFVATLSEAKALIEGALQKRGAMESPADGSGDGAVTTDASGAVVKQASGEIRSTKDVIDALERICVYYERYEPSSPIPLIIRRAQRLVSKSFLEIIRDMSPGSIDTIETITGRDPTSNT